MQVVNDVNVDDESPLDLAIENRKLQTCHFLISKGKLMSMDLIIKKKLLLTRFCTV